MPKTEKGSVPEDPRRPLEIRIQVLATQAQALALQDVLGAAICGAELDHDGPCRVAWSTGVTTDLSTKDRKFLWKHLGQVETWDNTAVNESLGIVDEV
ncbi:hypothetical protein [Kineosporia sp. NBRC 101731]|uniref:hypothetical protein n=1 Tax=Kineosporia sp. NBRC 101731 TaxID=3032199 RepID=UPI0024A3B6EE|nr:hypothetical protein [Kineosporia sp. NBRC 101731]GLY29503.1 hypothetical protein Kisp02_28680 [Kineosporia sp. NBRC 101731]